jgi:hypothetical protein
MRCLRLQGDVYNDHGPAVLGPFALGAAAQDGGAPARGADPRHVRPLSEASGLPQTSGEQRRPSPCRPEAGGRRSSDTLFTGCACCHGGSVTHRWLGLPVERTAECQTRGEGVPWAARPEREAGRTRRCTPLLVVFCHAPLSLRHLPTISWPRGAGARQRCSMTLTMPGAWRNCSRHFAHASSPSKWNTMCGCGWQKPVRQPSGVREAIEMSCLRMTPPLD